MDDILLKQANIARLGTPSSYDLDFLRKWLIRPRMGNFPLLGIDRHSYSEQYEKDLVAIRARSAPDFFSRWFTCGLIPKWHSAVGEKFKVGL